MRLIKPMQPEWPLPVRGAQRHLNAELARAMADSKCEHAIDGPALVRRFERRPHSATTRVSEFSYGSFHAPGVFPSFHGPRMKTFCCGGLRSVSVERESQQGRQPALASTATL